MKERVRARWLGKFVMLACLLSAFAATSANAAPGGPVILGGDDMGEHGSFNGTDNVDGWLYMQRALENISARVQRSNTGDIAVLASSGPSGGGFGEAAQSAADAAGLPATFYDGPVAMQQFFDDLVAGNVNPRIIWIAGDGVGNDIDSCSGAGTEGQILSDNSGRIDTFVNQGGGLLSHGSCYLWLQTLLPGISTNNNGASGDLYLTTAGTNAFPGLTNQNINAGPWHNYFEGDFGGLEVLVRSTTRQINCQEQPPPALTKAVSAAGATPGCEDAPVILGGAGVSLTQRPTDLAITKTADPNPVSVGGELTYSLTVTNNGPEEATNVVVTDDLPAGLTFDRANSSQGSCSGSGPVTCNLGSIPSGSAAAIGIVVRPSGPGTFRNVARVSGDQPDPDDSNNEASAETGVQAVAGERTCPDTRPFRFRTHHAPGSRIKRVRAFVNGEKVLDRKSDGDIKTFRIPRQPQVAGTVVKIILNHSNGTKVTSLRVYNACGKTTPTYKIKRKKKSKG